MLENKKGGAIAHSIGVPALALLVAGLAGCGGGGNESGPPDSLVVSPEAVSVGKPEQCIAALGPTVYVHGGTPPYKLSNSVPQGMVLDRSTLQNSGDGFTISFTGVCLRNMPVTVEDSMGRLARVSVSNGV